MVSHIILYFTIIGSPVPCHLSPAPSHQRVIAAWVKGIAFTQPLHAKPHCLEKWVCFKGLLGIITARGGEPADWGQNRRDIGLVKANKPKATAVNYAHFCLYRNIIGYLRQADSQVFNKREPICLSYSRQSNNITFIGCSFRLWHKPPQKCTYSAFDLVTNHSVPYPFANCETCQRTARHPRIKIHHNEKSATNLAFAISKQVIVFRLC